MNTNPQAARAAMMYDSWARAYDRDIQGKYTAAQEVIELALKHLESANHIIDAGIGTGLVTCGLKEKFKNCSFTGLDISIRMLEQCRYKLGSIDLKHCNLDGDNWPVADRSADAITSAGVLSMIDNLDLFMSESARALNQGGILVSSFLISINERMRLSLASTSPSLCKSFCRTYKEMQEVAAHHNLSLIDQKNEFTGFRTPSYSETYGICVFKKS